MFVNCFSPFSSCYRPVSPHITLSWMNMILATKASLFLFMDTWQNKNKSDGVMAEVGGDGTKKKKSLKTSLKIKKKIKKIS